MKKVLFLLILAAFLRLVPLGIPPSLNWDEVSHAYTSYLLLNKGTDQWGKFLPLDSFRAYGDYPTTLNVYLTAGVFGLFGDSDFTARLPHVIYGVLTVLLLYVLTSSLVKSTKVGFIVGLLACFEPWLVFPSRAIFQSNLALLLFTAGITLYIRKKLNLATLLFVISLFAYHTTRIVVPILSIALFRIKKYSQAFILILIPLIILMLPTSQARGRWVGLLNPDAIYSIEVARNSSSLPSLLSKVIHNRPVYIITTVVRNTLDYFSPHFLALTGGSQTQFSQPNFGLFSVGSFVLIGVGFIYAVKRKKILIVLILISLIPAVLTVDRFAVIRSTLSLPFWFILLSIGIKKLLVHKRELLLLGISTCIWLGAYYFNYLTVYPIKYASSWQYGYKQMISDLVSKQSEYSQFIITKRLGEPHEFYWWYTRTLDPELADSDFHDNWYWVNKYKNIYFVDDWKIVEFASQPYFSGTTLVIASPDHRPVGKIIQTINNPDGSPVFYLVEI